MLKKKDKEKESKEAAKISDEFDCEVGVGERAGATNHWVGQIKNPSNFSTIFNPKKDNIVPKEKIKIHHVFGIRNKYLKD